MAELSNIAQPLPIDSALAFPHRLEVAGRYEALPAISEWLQAVAVCCGLSASVTYRLDLVLTELVTNVMDYATRPDFEPRIEIACDCQADAVWLRVADDGKPFDPTGHAAPPQPGSLADATPGGLGIHLVRQYTASMAYHRDHDRNILTMSLSTGAPTPSEVRAPSHQFDGGRQ
jgi:anti-sigma regulatory factor (Ser/Thr protein kinase)